MVQRAWGLKCGVMGDGSVLVRLRNVLGQGDRVVKLLSVAVGQVVSLAVSFQSLKGWVSLVVRCGCFSTVSK